MQTASNDGDVQMAILPVAGVAEGDKKNLDVAAPDSRAGTLNNQNPHDVEAVKASHPAQGRTASPWINLAPWRKVVVFVGSVHFDIKMTSI